MGEGAETADSAQRIRHDELLVIRCQLGERDAFDALIDRWHLRLWQYARRMAGTDDAADDVVQDVWLRVLRGIGQLRDGTKLRPWLFGIARRVLMDRLRQQYARPAQSSIDAVDLAGDANNAGRAEEIALMERELERLPLAERDILVLFYLNDLSLQEIAEIAAIPVGTVKSRLHRARQALRQQLIAQGVKP